MEGTVATTIAHVAQTFRVNNRCDPRLDQDGKTNLTSQEQLRGYKNLDGAKLKQKALPLLAVRKMMELAITHKDYVMAWLFVGAIFFAMRSCEYMQTGDELSTRTKIIRIKNVIFKKEGMTMAQGRNEITDANMVAITFEYQKNDKKNKAVHMFKTGDNIMCPVIAWATNIRR